MVFLRWNRVPEQAVNSTLLFNQHSHLLEIAPSLQSAFTLGNSPFSSISIHTWKQHPSYNVYQRTQTHLFNKHTHQKLSLIILRLTSAVIS